MLCRNTDDSPTVPFYDRYFLGGPTTMRGFEFRDVGPKDLFGEPIGGKTYAFGSIEYSRRHRRSPPLRALL